MELIQAWLTIIGFFSVIYWVAKLGIWAYRQDREAHPGSPSVFTPWKK